MAMVLVVAFQTQHQESGTFLTDPSSPEDPKEDSKIKQSYLSEVFPPLGPPEAPKAPVAGLGHRSRGHAPAVELRKCREDYGRFP